MPEAPWDNGNREIEGASRAGCMFTETHPVISPNAATRNQSKHADMHPALMFHYRCLLVEKGCVEWCRCRNSPPFAAKCRTNATCQRKCNILPQSAAFCTFC